MNQQWTIRWVEKSVPNFCANSWVPQARRHFHARLSPRTQLGETDWLLTMLCLIWNHWSHPNPPTPAHSRAFQFSLPALDRNPSIFDPISLKNLNASQKLLAHLKLVRHVATVCMFDTLHHFAKFCTLFLSQLGSFRAMLDNFYGQFWVIWSHLFSQGSAAGDVAL